MGEGVVDILVQINMFDEEEEGVEEGLIILENNVEFFQEEIEGYENSFFWELNQFELEEVSKWLFFLSKLIFLFRKVIIFWKFKVLILRVKKGCRFLVLFCFFLFYCLLEVMEY